MNSCLATDCAVLMHAEYGDVSIERGLWWRPKRQMLTLAVLRCSQTPEITRLYEWGKTVSRVMKIRSGLFSIFLSLLPLIILAFNSCSALKGAFSLMVAMKSCSAQLRHQKGAMTARPHAARGNRTGSQKESVECFCSNTECPPPRGKRYKTQQLDKQPPPPPKINSHSPRPPQWHLHWYAGGHSFFLNFPRHLNHQCNLFLIPVCTAVSSPSSKQRMCCFTSSPTNPDHSAFRQDQEESVNNA